MAPEFAATCCVINGEIMNLNEVENMGYQEFNLRSKLSMPPKLYKYFPNSIEDKKGEKVNYSIQALKNATVFMQSPSEFDDVYDSDISIDYYVYERLRLKEYCNRCQIEIKETFSTQEIGNILINALAISLSSTGNFNSAFVKKPNSKIEKLANEHFCSKLIIELNNKADLGQAVAKVIRSDFEEYTSMLKNTFRTTCFTTTPYSQLMWGGSYADCHKGFCVEYTVLPEAEEYQKVYQNLFPMIYCKVRPDMAERLTRLQNVEFTEESLWDIYLHGALRKSIDWAFQNEWRLLLPMKEKDSLAYNVKFFPITKVFLGNRMTQKKRQEIIEICHSQGIPYIGVMRNPSVFEMQECGIKCEECVRYNRKER